MKAAINSYIVAIASQKELDRISGNTHLNHTYLGATK